MQGVDQAVDGACRVLLGGVGQLGIEGSGGGARVPEQALDVAKAQALFEQMSGEAVAQGVDGDFFLIPDCATTAFMAACVPPRSMCVVA